MGLGCWVTAEGAKISQWFGERDIPKVFVPFQYINRMLNSGLCHPPLCWQAGKTRFILKLVKQKLQDSSVAGPFPRPWESLGKDVI